METTDGNHREASTKRDGREMNCGTFKQGTFTQQDRGAHFPGTRQGLTHVTVRNEPAPAGTFCGVLLPPLSGSKAGETDLR